MMTAILLASLLAMTIPPAPGNRISDGAELLSSSQTKELETLFQEVEARQGVRLGLLTLANLDDDPKAVSVRALNYWNMSPDSVLLLISTNPRKVFLQPGSNLQYRFNESTSVGIIRDHIVPALKSGRYGAGILNGFHAISSTLPGPAVAPAPNTPTRPEPIRMAPVAIVGVGPPEPSFVSQHPFLLFLLISGTILGIILLVRVVLRERRETEEARREELESFRSMQRAIRAEALRKDSEPAASPSRDSTSQQPRVSVPLSPPAAPVVVAPANNSSVDLLTGVMIGDALSRSREREVVREVVVERPAPPPPSPPRRRSDDDDRSSRGGGGGYDWSSSSSSSSDSGGGGGSDWGGGGSDGGGGGGSDW